MKKEWWVHYIWACVMAIVLIYGFCMGKHYANKRIPENFVTVYECEEDEAACEDEK